LSWWLLLEEYWSEIAAWTAALDMVLIGLTIPWVLMTKKDATSAVAWCLVIFFLPLMGPVLFLLFGYQHVRRPLARKRRHRKLYGIIHAVARPEVGSGSRDSLYLPAGGGDGKGERSFWEVIPALAERLGASPASQDNALTFYHEGQPAFEAMIEVIRSARHHIHLETYIFEADATGRLFLEALAQKAREGVEVRLLYDAMGSYRLARRLLTCLVRSGGRCSVFLPINLLRRRVQVNLRNHRKILVVDGRVGFLGGLNIGEEYRGKDPRYGYWRDTHLQLEGPAVQEIQRVFSEDWDFAANEDLHGPVYFPPPQAAGPYTVQVIDSGPDRELKSIREMYFAAILRARQRVWIATPYFVPDAGLLDALRLAGHLGLDVRLLGQYRPDKWIPFFASRYYWSEVLEAGVKVYQYTKGMMHSKVVLVDGQWASVGSANLDNRSLHLNFEVNCLVYSPKAVDELEAAFRRDLAASIRLDRRVYARRPLPGRLMENACRMLSPVL
jgi:cardiolipin synthase